MKAVVYKSNMHTFRYEVGKSGTDIDFVDADNGVGDYSLIGGSSLGGRGQVLRLQATDAGVCDFDHTGFDITSTGVIEFMAYIDAANQDLS